MGVFRLRGRPIMILWLSPDIAACIGLPGLTRLMLSCNTVNAVLVEGLFGSLSLNADEISQYARVRIASSSTGLSMLSP